MLWTHRSVSRLRRNPRRHMENLCPPKEETCSHLSRRPQVFFFLLYAFFFLKKSLFPSPLSVFFLPGRVLDSWHEVSPPRGDLTVKRWTFDVMKTNQPTNEQTNKQTNSWPALTMKQEIKGCWLECLRATPPWPSPHPPRWLFTLGWLSARPDTTVTNDNGTAMVEEGGHSQWMFTAQMLIS